MCVGLLCYGSVVVIYNRGGLPILRSRAIVQYVEHLHYVYIQHVCYVA